MSITTAANYIPTNSNTSEQAAIITALPLPVVSSMQNDEIAHVAKESVAAKLTEKFSGAINYTTSQLSTTTAQAATLTANTAHSAMDTATNTAKSAIHLTTSTASSAVNFALGTASSAVHFALGTASSAINLTTSTASSAINLTTSTASSAINLTTSTASSAVHFASETTYNVASYAVHTTKDAVLSTAAIAKPYLPESITSRGEKLYDIAQEAIVDPMEAAHSHLPQPVYASLKWSVDTTLSTAQEAKKRVDATCEYTLETVQSTKNRVAETKDKIVNDALNTVQQSVAFGKRNVDWAIGVVYGYIR